MDIKRFLTSSLGLGRLPIAPGTWGSLPPTIIFGLMCCLGASVMSISIVMAVLALAGSVVCVQFAPAVIAITGKNDPAEVVADETAGQAVTFIFACPALKERFVLAAILGFLLFRFMDILKPWPIRKLEKLPLGWGILADDLLAGVYAGLVLLICLQIGLI